MAFIIIILFIAVIGGVAFMVMKTLNKLNAADAANGGLAANSAVVDTVQKFLPFDNIRDGIVDLGNFRYRMIIECSSINYALKTDEEQEIIELGFQRVLNSLQFPFTLYVQTREIDNRAMIASLEEDIAEAKEDFPILSDYGDSYLQEMKNLTANLGQTKQKKKYIIVPFDEAVELTTMDKEERFQYAKDEIFQRAQLIKDGMSSLQIKASILDTPEVIELLYSAFHKDGTTDVENIQNGEFLRMMVEGVYEDKNNGQLLIGNRMAHMEPFEKMYLIFTQAEKWIRAEVVSTLSDVEYQALADAALQKLEELRNSTEDAYIDIRDEKLGIKKDSENESEDYEDGGDE